MLMTQTQTQAHPHRPDLRRRAERLISALDDTPAPQTLTDIIRAARTLMVIDRLLTQLWKTSPVKSERPPAVSQAAPADGGHSDDTAEPALAAFDAPPLNRHQRRLKAAQERHVRHDSDLSLRKETGSLPRSP